MEKETITLILMAAVVALVSFLAYRMGKRSMTEKPISFAEVLGHLACMGVGLVAGHFLLEWLS